MMRQNLDHEQKIALAFSVAINGIAIVVLLHLGMSQPPQPAKPIQAVLLTPDAVRALQNDAKTDIQHENLTEQVQSRTIVDAATALPTSTQTPVVPNNPEPAKQAETQPVDTPEPVKPRPSTSEKVTTNQATEQVDPTLAARLRAEKAVRDAKLRAAENLKKEQAEKLKQKRDEQQALKEATKKTETKAVDAKKADQKANDLKKSAEDARKKAEADAKANTNKNQNQPQTEALNVGQQAEQDGATRRGEIRRLVSSAKRDFESKIYRAWDIPLGTSGQKATARVVLDDNGNVRSVVVDAANPDIKASVEAAIRAAAPYPMPSDPEARKEARSFRSTFTAK